MLMNLMRGSWLVVRGIITDFYQLAPNRDPGNSTSVFFGGDYLTQVTESASPDVHLSTFLR
jgi:hypothetical protein